MICMDELTPFRVWPMLSLALQEAREGLRHAEQGRRAAA
jgi:hypothetical protein